MVLSGTFGQVAPHVNTSHMAVGARACAISGMLNLAVGARFSRESFSRESMERGCENPKFYGSYRRSVMRVHLCVLLVGFILVSLPGRAQHVEIGGFASYGNFDVPRFPSTAVGAGGRIDVNLTSYFALEGEGSYDFKHPRVEIVGVGTGRFDVTSLRLGAIHGNGGFKFQSKSGSYFLFVKGGIIDFQPDIRTTSLIGALLSNAPRSGTNFTEGVLYPGGGIGFHAGPLRHSS